VTIDENPPPRSKNLGKLEPEPILFEINGSPAARPRRGKHDRRL
jgi:hypothetical protein